MSASTFSHLAEEACDTLGQLMALLQKMSADQYGSAQTIDSRQSVGKHVRHIIDHFDALLTGMSDAGEWVIDYEHRQRDLAVEQDPKVAVQNLERLRGSLAELATWSTQKHPLHVTHATGDQPSWLASSLERELVFLTSHAIHHMAIIALLADSSEIEVAPTFGVHPSTLRYWQRTTPEPLEEVTL
ncbi:DinB family protein [Halomonas sp. 18H]|nr:DinB family protein [Halomonas sp. 18H]MCW4152145.1 DinB family protein [Halomonas sp. 18H]